MTTEVTPIDVALPGLAAHPRTRFGLSPTPIDAAPRLGDRLGCEVHVKRDDLTGLAFGGNKVRQCEFYLGAAEAADATCILITSAVQSNFVRTATAAARTLGMSAHVQLEDRVPNNHPAYRHSGNVLLDRLLGAHIHHYPEGEDEAGADRSIDALAAELEERGERPYVIHLGTDHPPLGGLGYAVCGHELAVQFAERGQVPDAIVVASGSALTHAGLLVGLRAVGLEVPIYGICVRRPVAEQSPRVLQRAEEIAALVGRPGLISKQDVITDDRVFPPGYGRMTDTIFEAMRLGAETEGLMLDPVYTGKSFAGMVALIRDGLVAPTGQVLFVHTGGGPGIFGYEGSITPYLD